MSEQENERGNRNDIFHNRLKDVDIRTLQDAIAKVVGDLVGVELECSISKIDYSRIALSTTCAGFDVLLSEPFKGFGEPTKTVK